MTSKTLNEFYDLEDIQLNYQPKTGVLNSSWGNLGCWLDDTNTPINDYSQACQQLAVELGRLAKLDKQVNLSEGHKVLDTGFGCGDQLAVWSNEFHVKQLMGINFSHSQTAYALNKIKGQQKDNSYILKQGDCCDPFAWQSVPKSLDRIIALDCLYHFKNKPAYFKLCNQHMADHGILAVSDLILVKPIHNPVYKWILKIICKLSHIPFQNLMTLSHYQQLLIQQGLVLSQAEDISHRVFLPFGQWLNSYISEMKKHNKTRRKLSWAKYKFTAIFLRWAHNKQILGYQLLQVSQLKNSIK
ncbi:MAG: cyclopropane fatty-acyl-phospholipid synthase-like methyltransferase [Bermanella sp.]|jgi:cyclopropane fatty-acyl-phospholipid synthase-like methyltransferase